MLRSYQGNSALLAWKDNISSLWVNLPHHTMLGRSRAAFGGFLCSRERGDQYTCQL